MLNAMKQQKSEEEYKEEGWAAGGEEEETGHSSRGTFYSFQILGVLQGWGEIREHAGSSDAGNFLLEITILTSS